MKEQKVKFKSSHPKGKVKLAETEITDDSDLSPGEV